MIDKIQPLGVQVKRVSGLSPPDAAARTNYSEQNLAELAQTAADGAHAEYASTMADREVTISNKLGLHARASAKLVQLLQGFKSNAWLVHRGREINAKSIMGVMMLAAGIGQTITIRTDGPDEFAALAAMADLFERKFDDGV